MSAQHQDFRDAVQRLQIERRASEDRLEQMKAVQRIMAAALFVQRVLREPMPAVDAARRRLP